MNAQLKIQQEIVEQALLNLELETGLRPEWHELNIEYDGELTFQIQNERIRFYVEVKKELRLYNLDRILEVAKHNRPFMVIAGTLLNNVREKLKEEGIAFIDANGNAHIAEGGIFIVINGRKNPEQQFNKPATNRAFTRTGLKAVFHLLNDPTAIEKNYRQLATETDIALGNIKYIMDGLREAGFLMQINKTKVKLQEKKALLDRWITGYREILKPTLFKGAYSVFNKQMYLDWYHLDTQTLEITWGGEPAAEIITGYLKAKQLTIYTNALRGKLMKELKAFPDEKGDILIYEKFWKQNNERNHDVAPLLLVYADLLITEDPRCIEAAKMIYDKYLKDELETN